MVGRQLGVVLSQHSVFVLNEIGVDADEICVMISHEFPLFWSVKWKTKLFMKSDCQSL